MKQPIQQTNAKPQPSPEELAVAIVATAQAAKKLLSSRLSNKAIFLLIQHAMPVGNRCTLDQIATVLQSAADMEKSYIRKPVK